MTLYADPRIVAGSHWITGANKKDMHARFVTNGRDFQVEKYLEAAEVRDTRQYQRGFRRILVRDGGR